MTSVREINAKQIVNENPFTVKSDQSISKIRDKMEDRNLRAVAVTDSKNRLQGAISYRDLIRTVQFNPDSTKLSKVMHAPPEFDINDSLVEVCDLRINSGRKLMVLTEGKKLKGIISDEEFRAVLGDVDEIKRISTRDIATHEVITAFEEDLVEEVRHMMLDNNISRVPILNEDGNLTGVIRSTEILQTLVTRDGQNPGGTSGRDRKDTNIAGGNEKEKMSSITTSEIMNRTPTTHEGHFSGDEAIDLMEEKGTHEVLVMNDKYPESVVTLKDFIKHISESELGNTILVNLVGLEVEEEKAAAHDQIKRQLRGSLGRKLDNPQELNLHVKKAEKDGKKHRYEVALKLFSDLGQFTVNEEAWDLMDVVDSALSELNVQVRKKKEKQKEHRN